MDLIYEGTEFSAYLIRIFMGKQPKKIQEFSVMVNCFFRQHSITGYATKMTLTFLGLVLMKIHNGISGLFSCGRHFQR